METHRLTGPGTDRFPFFVQRKRIGVSYQIHGHDFTEIDIVTAGTATHWINGVPRQVAPGDVCVFNPGTMHGYTDGIDLEVCDVMYDAQGVGVEWSHLRKIEGFQSLFLVSTSLAGSPSHRCWLRLGARSLRAVDALVGHMLDEYRAGRPGCEAELAATLVRLIVEITRQHKRNEPSATGEARGLARAAAHIEVHFQSEVRLAELARLAGVSPWRLIRLFRRHYRCTPIDYLVQRRLEHAKRLLLSGNQSVTEIALSCGYNDPNHFTRAFRRRTGRTPSSFRQ